MQSSDPLDAESDSELPMTPRNSRDLCEALLLWRYLGHRVTRKDSVGLPLMRFTLAKAERTLQLAKMLGIGKEYLELDLAHPILSIRCDELE